MKSYILAALALLTVSVAPADALEIKSDTRPGALPSLIAPGEIAINRADGRFFYRDEVGNRAGGLLPDLDASGYLKFRNGLTLGRYQGGKFTSQPDAIETSGLRVLGAAAAPLAIPYVSEVPQGDFYTRSFIQNPGRGLHPNKSISDLAVVHIADGSGKNGPLSSDQAGVFAVIKKGFPNSPVRGEVDTLNLFGRQSGPRATSADDASDMNVVTGNYVMAGDGPGFAAWMEFRGLWIEDVAPYNTKIDFGGQIGVIDPYGGNITGNRYASINPRSWLYGAIPSIGTPDYAFYAENGSATYFKEFARLNVGGVRKFSITGGSGSDAGAVTWGAPSAFTSFIPDGSGNIVVKDTGGNTVAGFYQGGSVYLNQTATNNIDVAGVAKWGTPQAFTTIGNDGSGNVQIKDTAGNLTAAFYQGGTAYLNQTATNSVSVTGHTTLTNRNTIVYKKFTDFPPNPMEGETIFIKPNAQSLSTIFTFADGAWRAHY